MSRHVFRFCVTQLDPSIYESLQKERVEVGDVIYIEANSGAVKVRTTHNLLLSLLNTHWFRVLRQCMCIRQLTRDFCTSYC